VHEGERDAGRQQQLGAVIGTIERPLVVGPADHGGAGGQPHQATPEKVQAALAAFEKLINETMASTGLAGLAVAVVYRDQVVDLKGYGVREVGQPDLVDAHTVFQLASVWKPLSATVLAGLVGDQVITWDDRIADLDPSFALSDPYVTANVTVRQREPAAG